MKIKPVLFQSGMVEDLPAGWPAEGESSGVLLAPTVQVVKRLVDVLGAVAGLAVGWPVFVLLAILIRLDSPGPVLYTQWRVGRMGRPFRLWKFRSMLHPPGQGLEEKLHSDSDLRRDWDRFQKLPSDPRITRLGRFLRRYSLDELPQLWNVLQGEMSLVGPRPFFEEQRQAYGAAYQHYIRLRPGLTGMWQVSGRNLASFAERAAWDEYYVLHWSVWLECAILARTVWVVLRGEGAY
jgi:lipopolysaccharide/colanic/teichoic acid biosynthesis glycosyltransferase